MLDKLINLKRFSLHFSRLAVIVATERKKKKMKLLSCTMEHVTRIAEARGWLLKILIKSTSMILYDPFLILIA